MNAKLFDFSLQEHGKYVAMFVSFVFFSLILRTFFFLLTPSEATIKTFSSNAVEVKSQAKLTFLVPLFGVYVPPGDENIEKSSLNINIVGIFYANAPKESEALIEVNGATHLYHAEDTLPQGAIIKKIRKDGIVIFYEGKLESLTIKKHELIFKDIPR